MDVPTREPEILELLREVRWDRIASGLSMPLEYGQYASDVLLKAHLLPYLLPLRSERQLAFAIAEKDILRRCVGLTDDRSPQRGTLWHFRKRNLQLFRKLLVRALSVIYLEAEARKITVPFLSNNSCTDEDAMVDDNFHDRPFDARVEISYPLQPRLVTREEQLSLPLDIQGRAFSGVAPRLLLPDQIGFPLRVTVRRMQPPSCVACVVFQQPSWLNEPYGHYDIGQYIGGENTPYTACNIVVARSVDGREQILLSKRLAGAGMGSYTLPGGKKRDNETVRACVRRELEEETGLILTDAWPVSVRNTNRQGYPRVRSIGVQVAVRGEPQLRERHQHSNWQWYDVAHLPAPLFFPTRLVLKDFLANRVGDLAWDDVEDSEDLPLLRKG
jgi:8-oxo-dGTP diphosphatase